MGRPPEKALFRRELKKAFRARHGRRFPPLFIVPTPQKYVPYRRFSWEAERSKVVCAGKTTNRDSVKSKVLGIWNWKRRDERKPH